jgi:hypothetical protein
MKFWDILKCLWAQCKQKSGGPIYAHSWTNSADGETWEFTKETCLDKKKHTKYNQPLGSFRNIGDFCSRKVCEAPDLSGWALLFMSEHKVRPYWLLILDRGPHTHTHPHTHREGGGGAVTEFLKTNEVNCLLMCSFQWFWPSICRIFTLQSFKKITLMKCAVVVDL